MGILQGGGGGVLPSHACHGHGEVFHPHRNLQPGGKMANQLMISPLLLEMFFVCLFVCVFVCLLFFYKCLHFSKKFAEPLALPLFDQKRLKENKTPRKIPIKHQQQQITEFEF